MAFCCLLFAACGADQGASDGTKTKGLEIVEQGFNYDDETGRYSLVCVIENNSDDYISYLLVDPQAYDADGNKINFNSRDYVGFAVTNIAPGDRALGVWYASAEDFDREIAKGELYPEDYCPPMWESLPAGVKCELRPSKIYVADGDEQVHGLSVVSAEYVQNTWPTIEYDSAIGDNGKYSRHADEISLFEVTLHNGSEIEHSIPLFGNPQFHILFKDPEGKIIGASPLCPSTDNEDPIVIAPGEDYIGTFEADVHDFDSVEVLPVWSNTEY